jgi:hypothetical protein
MRLPRPARSRARKNEMISTTKQAAKKQRLFIPRMINRRKITFAPEVGGEQMPTSRNLR